jgi:hypothetical protein
MVFGQGDKQACLLPGSQGCIPCEVSVSRIYRLHLTEVPDWICSRLIFCCIHRRTLHDGCGGSDLSDLDL